MSAFPRPLKIRKDLLIDTTAEEWAAGLERIGYVVRFCSPYAAVCSLDKAFTVAEYVEGDELVATYRTCDDYMEARRACVAFHQQQNS
ncbi:MAG: hypothetical protein DI628_00730 [Blastochloris viridis]|uniref:Uncharacterized protein n=1 Tax=Blastochloris viridis TaxID=1079 RepID=A0A6N4RDI2_BLAVI|nr:MAG: hypothetical protein DI628_00730 [Blastochloris viridis]